MAKARKKVKTKTNAKKKSATKTPGIKAKIKKKSPKLGFLHGLRTAVYFVDDVDKAKSWYSEVMGVTPYFDEPFYVGFNVGGYELGLHPRSEKYPGVIGGMAAYWGVTDAAEAFARLLRHGATEYAPIEDVGGGIKIGAVKDPFGNLFGIIENPTFNLP